jgi:CheY-like chemotaxis protein
MAVVLVVEDEAQVRLLAETILEDAGHRTLSAGTIAEAMALLRTKPEIDVLFTDINLVPDMRAGSREPGLELARLARSVRPELRVLYTTGGDRTSLTRQRLSGEEFLPKPYDVASLRAKIAQSIRR